MLSTIEDKCKDESLLNKVIKYLGHNEKSHLTRPTRLKIVWGRAKNDKNLKNSSFY